MLLLINVYEAFWFTTSSQFGSVYCELNANLDVNLFLDIFNYYFNI